MNKLRKSFDLNMVSYYSLLLFAFSLSLSRAAISFFVFWFLLLVIVKRDYKNSFNILKENKIFLYMGIFLTFILFSSFWGDDGENTLKYIRLYAYWIVIPCIVILADKKWMNNAMNAFLLGMFVNVILSFFIFFDIWSVNGRPPSYPSPFMGHIHYSIFLAFTSLVLLYKVLFEKLSIRFKIALFIFFILTVINLMNSNGRTGVLAFFVTLFILFLIKYKISIKSFLISFSLFVTIAFLSYTNISIFKTRIDTSASSINKVIKDKNFNTSIGIRLAYWILAYDALKEKPILGHGLGDHKLITKELIDKNKYVYMDQYVKDFVSSYHYHNQYLMLLVEGGLVSLFLFLFFIFKLYLLKIEDLKMKDISIIGVSVILVASIAEPILFLQFPLVLYLFIVSFSIVNSK